MTTFTRKHHLNVTLTYLEKAARAGESLLDNMAPDEALDAILQARADGIEYVAVDCTDFDDAGKCNGHEI